jgi:uncharacterized protein YukE
MRASTTNTIVVDGGALHTGASDLGEVATAIDGASDQLAAALAAEGACWGGDPAGARFGTEYQPLRDAAEQAFGDLSRAVRGFAGLLGQAAGNAQAADHRAQDRLA